MNASLERSTATMVTALFDQAEYRAPEHLRRWTVLLDGANHQLDCLTQEAARRGVSIDIIVDFVHVLEHSWKAADALHPAHPTHSRRIRPASRRRPARSPRPPEWAPTCTPTNAPTPSPTGRPRPGPRRRIPGSQQLCLDYHIALTLGWPIATGDIEGSCRYLVKDRLDVTGARWSLPGSEAVLHLRAVIADGDFTEYWQRHMRCDCQRTHAALYQEQLDIAA